MVSRKDDRIRAAEEEAPAAGPERIVAIAPFGRDQDVLVSLLERHGFGVVGCRTDTAGLHNALRPGADVILLTAEAFRRSVLDILGAHLYAEPVWSMPPVVLVAEDRASAQRVFSTLRKARPGVPVSILIRPCAEIEITSAVTSAVETRRQQVRIRDLIARHERAERQAEFLFRELSHRVKNLFNLVSAIAVRTSRAAADGKTFRQNFRGRLEALASTYAVLGSAGWERAELGEIITSAVRPLLSPSEEARFVAQGPPVSVSGNVASSLGLVMHELASNARKYGALSGSNGCIDVAWRLEANRVILEWREHGGPPVAPPSKQGFGTTVITESMTGIPGAEVNLGFRPEGAVCRISFEREANTAV
ncbi:MAG: sensor histidine kinase [Alphaproteobacteria bacterium]